jgi:hypothetical protein
MDSFLLVVDNDDDNNKEENSLNLMLKQQPLFYFFCAFYDRYNKNNILYKLIQFISTGFTFLIAVN